MKTLALVEELFVRDNARVLPRVISGYEFLRPSRLPEWDQIKEGLIRRDEDAPDRFVVGITSEFNNLDYPAYEGLDRIVSGLRLIRPNAGRIRYLIDLDNLSSDKIVSVLSPQNTWIANVFPDSILTPDDFNKLRDIFPTLNFLYTSGKYTRLRNAFDFYNHTNWNHSYTDILVNLVSGLESIFITVEQELAETLCTRAAWFTHPLMPDSVGRKELFVDLKKMYNLRSRILHGGDISSFSREEKDKSLSVAVGVLRHGLIKILRDEVTFDKFIGNKKELDDYFRDLVFGGVSP